MTGSFLVPLAASLKQAGLKLDVDVANAHVGRWLTEVANVRVHGTTNERPLDRLLVEREHLMLLPPQPVIASPARRSELPVPVESLQHPLSLYDELLEVSA